MSADVLTKLTESIEARRKSDPKDSYVASLHHQGLNKILEKMISRDPGQWIWTHNRWK